MRIGFILTTYNRIDDFLAHLEILKYFPHQHEVIPIWMKDQMPEYFLDEMKKYPLAHYKNGLDFHLGPLVAFIDGLRTAAEAGIDYCVYRNGDDWIMNHERCLANFTLLDRQKKDVAAYNWLTYNTMREFAMNDMYVRVQKFMETIDEAEKMFLKSSKRVLCEWKISKWINKTTDKFHRLSGRELSPGVGYHVESFPYIFSMLKQEIPDGFWGSLENNNRFFNKEWQLIGSHNNKQRRAYYDKIKKDIPYHIQLEQEEHFSRWLSGGEWNIPIDKPKKKYKPMPKKLITVPE